MVNERCFIAVIVNPRVLRNVEGVTRLDYLSL